MYEPTIQVELQTTRHTYSDEIAEELSNFAKIHEYDGRKDFKEAWKEWLNEEGINEKINKEVLRLEGNGLKGDIIDRMYKSTRYYYRKKTCKSDIEKDIKKRKPYVGLPKSVLVEMDVHIYSEINGSIELIDKVTGKSISNVNQSASFTKYYRENYEMIKTMIPNNIENNTDNENIRKEIKGVTDKLKKTYKNRFYKIKVKLQEMKTI